MTDPLTELTEALGKLAMAPMASAPDLQALMAAQRRNLEALATANKVALDGAQALARRQMEILQQMASEFSQTMETVSQPAAPQEKAAQQTERLKHAYAQALDQARELRDLMQTANAETLQVLNTRFLEALDEVKAMLKATGG